MSTTSAGWGKRVKAVIYRNLPLWIALGAICLVMFVFASAAERRTTLFRLREEMHYWLPAFLGLVILWNESRLKRELHDRELQLGLTKFEAEREERRERLKMLQEETESLGALSGRLATRISKDLAADTRWASQAMERAKLGWYGKTLFGERVGHFYDEKQQVAEHFARLLLERCSRIISADAAAGTQRRIRIFVDSGTTLYPFFAEFGRAAVRVRENHESWIDQVELVTNNLPGVEMLMDYGRRNPNNRYSGLAINCQLLPGAPLPVYSAVTGPVAVQAVKALKSEFPNDLFIALLTGNWVRLDTDLKCPVPLARGEGHIDLKQEFIDSSDEVYVVAPLGKIFLECDLETVNKALDLHASYHDPDKHPYEQLTIVRDQPESDATPGSKARSASKVKLVTTTREDGRLLSDLSRAVITAVGCFSDDTHQDKYRREFAAMPVGEPHHVFFPFSQLPDNSYEELQVEFPHRLTRRPEIRERYFLVRKLTERYAAKEPQHATAHGSHGLPFVGIRD